MNIFKKISFFILLVCSTFLPAVSQNMWVTGYYPTWAWDNGYDDTQIPYDAITHIIYFSTNPSQTAPYYDSTEFITNTWSPQWVASVKAHGVKPLLCVGGVWGQGAIDMDFIGSDSVRTYTFAERASSFALRKGFAGIDIDWEPPSVPQASCDRMLRAFTFYLSKWPTRGLLTVAATQAIYAGEGYSSRAVNEMVDQFNMMNYDLGQGQTAGFNAGLHVPNYTNYTSWTWDDHGPGQALAIGILPSKVACGIPFYARGNFGVTIPGQAQQSYYSPFYNYQDIVAIKSTSNFHWDSISLVPWLADVNGFSGFPSGLTFLSYDDEQSIAAKVNYAKNLKLGGVMEYELRTGWIPTGANLQARNPLAYAVKYSIGGKTNITTIGTAVNSYILYQNYPNPFNPSTTLSYYIPIKSHVNLEIVNTLGVKVATLVDGTQEQGTYSVIFNASKLSSGVYFYKLVTPHKIISKTMILLK